MQAHGSGGSGASVGAGRTVTVIVSVPRWYSAVSAAVTVMVQLPAARMVTKPPSLTVQTEVSLLT